MKKFIANATKSPGTKGVTNKVLSFFKYEGDAVLETNELTVNQVRRIIAKNFPFPSEQKYKKIIVSR